MSALSENKRSDSFESIPDVEFIKQTLVEEMASCNVNIVSEFKKKELNGELKPEPLLIEDKGRFVLFPIKHADVRNTNSLF